MKKYKTFVFLEDQRCKDCGAHGGWFLRVWNGKKWCILRKCRNCVNEDRMNYYEKNREKILERQRVYDRGRANAKIKVLL